VLLHRFRVGGSPTCEPLRGDGKKSSVEIEGLLVHVHEHTETDLGDGVEDAGVDAVPLSVDVGSALGDVESSDVGFVGPASGVWNNVKLLGVVTEVALVIVVGWEGLVELVAGHADK